jgi:transcriptional regulator with XRE-family HTH domain
MISARLAYESLHKALIEARHAAGLTQAEVADKLSRPQSFVSKYEQGERRLDVIEFVAVCHALDVDPLEVLKSLMGHG